MVSSCLRLTKNIKTTTWKAKLGEVIPNQNTQIQDLITYVAVLRNITARWMIVLVYAVAMVARQTILLRYQNLLNLWVEDNEEGYAVEPWKFSNLATLSWIPLF